MFKIFRYCAFIIAVHVVCQVHSKIHTRIINGMKAQPNQFPFFARLTISHEKVDGSRTSKHECGGSLISENVILTAAHCLYTNDKIEVRARCGFYDGNDTDDEQTHFSKQNIVHENFDPNTLENDIALVLLATNVKFTNTVKPIQYSCEYTPPHTLMAIIGHGRVGGTQEDLPNRLYWTVMTSISNQDCAKIYDDVSPTLICAKGRVSSSCHGDSGGPAMRIIDSVYKLIALVSFGATGQCDSGVPNGFTRVGSYSNWIAEKSMNSSLKCS